MRRVRVGAPPAASAMDNVMDVDKALEATFEGAPPHPDGPAGVEPAGNEGASLTFEGLLKRAKKKFIGHLDGPVASGERSCCRRSRCSRARRRRRRRLSPPLLCRCHQTSCQPRDRHRQSLYHPPNPRLCRRCHRSLTPASLHACERRACAPACSPSQARVRTLPAPVLRPARRGARKRPCWCREASDRLGGGGSIAFTPGPDHMRVEAACGSVAQPHGTSDRSSRRRCEYRARVYVTVSAYMGPLYTNIAYIHRV